MMDGEVIAYTKGVVCTFPRGCSVTQSVDEGESLRRRQQMNVSSSGVSVNSAVVLHMARQCLSPP